MKSLNCWAFLLSITLLACAVCNKFSKKRTLLLTILFTLFINQIVVSQIEQNDITTTYSKKLQEKRDSIVLLYEQKSKHKFLTLLPSVSYDALNKSFNIGFSLTALSNYYQQTKRNKIQLAQLELRLNEKLDNDLDKLNLEVQNFHINYITLKNSIDLFQIDFDLFLISQGKYNNNEITTEEFLKLKKSFLSKKNALNTSVLELHLIATKIKLKTKSDELTSSLLILTNSINKYD